MTSNQPSESKRSVYDTCDPHYLRELREAAGMDVVVLARTACLSVAQVRQLESDASDNLFYSDAIKRQAYKRLLMILGAEPPTIGMPQEFSDPTKVAQAHLNTLDQIVAMSHQPPMNHSISAALQGWMLKLMAHKQVLSSLLLLVVAVVLLIWHDPQSTIELDAAAAPASVSAFSVRAQSLPIPEPAATALPIAAPVASAPASAVAVLASQSAPAALPVVATSAATTSKSNVCAYSNESMPQLTPFIAQKEGRYVYFVSAANAEVCVVDGNKQATTLQLKVGENRSVYGVSPWQISSASFAKVQIYFQGGRVSLPDATTRVKLIEVPVSH